MKELIYCQRQIPRHKWRYGLRSSAAVGCGWIATYNALRLMGYTVDIPKLIRDVCILFYRWREKWKLGAHFVALQYRDGSFTGYNTYRNSRGPDAYGESLEAFLKRKKYFGTFLIGIRRRA